MLLQKPDFAMLKELAARRTSTRVLGFTAWLKAGASAWWAIVGTMLSPRS